MKFFLPDWDDRVDPGYDFLTERFTLNRDIYRDDQYAHELFNEQVYDGVLVSRMALGESGPKRQLVDRTGMAAYLRLPAGYELLGDCGAYGYVRLKDPCFDTADVVDYYDRLGFDYGVSVDHLILPEFDDERDYRYNLTLRNAESFLAARRTGKHRFTPIGAVQGWDVYSYVEAARAVVGMGYDYIALGGLARSNTRVITEIATAVRAALPPKTRIHIFGVARLSLLPLFMKLEITSADSAAPVRQAWLSAKDNYYTTSRTYAAIRIPKVDEERARGHTLVGRSDSAFAELGEAEQAALAAIRSYDRGIYRLPQTLDAIMTFDAMLASRRYGETVERRTALYRETLKDKPWKKCPCTVCRQLGVEVVIFRGNNRNRRRGFHNLWVLKRRIEAASAANDESSESYPKSSATDDIQSRRFPFVFEQASDAAIS